jgi:hypothetical protein
VFAVFLAQRVDHGRDPRDAPRQPRRRLLRLSARRRLARARASTAGAARSRHLRRPTRLPRR